MVEKAAILNKKLETKVKSTGNDEYFDVFDMIGKCALDIIYGKFHNNKKKKNYIIL